MANIFEPGHEISNNEVCATSKGSDQPAHARSLIRAFASRNMKLSCHPEIISPQALKVSWAIEAVKIDSSTKSKSKNYYRIQTHDADDDLSCPRELDYQMLKM